jgi:predicted SnoaL-like aldol condensation-catalyzing enzyme
MSKATPEQDKILVIKAFDALFNMRDYAPAGRFWSDRYIQHSAHIAPCQDGLFDLVRSVPPRRLTRSSGILVATSRHDNSSSVRGKELSCLAPAMSHATIASIVS